MNDQTMPDLEMVNKSINNLMDKLDVYVERGIRSLEAYLEEFPS
jgi:hypothetical protein